MTVGTIGCDGPTPWRPARSCAPDSARGHAGDGGAGRAAVPRSLRSGCSFVARVLQVRGGEAMREAGIEFGALPPR